MVNVVAGYIVSDGLAACHYIHCIPKEGRQCTKRNIYCFETTSCNFRLRDKRYTPNSDRLLAYHL